MKILATKQIQALDAFTITHEPISSIDLMERASRGIFNWLSSHYIAKTSFTIFCGPGNNGGDGLAVARLLYKHGFKVKCYLIASESYSADNLINQERYKQFCELHTVSTIQDLPEIDSTCVIDALFGAGLSKPIEGMYREVIQHINTSNKEIIAIDIASGLVADRPSTSLAIVQPTFTLSLELPKLAFMLPENHSFVGDWKIIPIDLHPKGIEAENTPYNYTESIENTTQRSKFSHKGNFGHALLIAGSYGKMGAAVLASKACMRSGVGLLTTHVPKSGYQIMQISLPEAMTSVDKHEEHFTTSLHLEPYAAIGIGPGLGTSVETQKALETLLQNIQKPLVLDADALNCIALKKELLLLLPANSILTPHPKEFERLVGTWNNDFEKLAVLQDFCKKHHLITVLKGAHTAVCLPNGEIHFNSTGNPAMATAGSGDVLTGIILAYLSQGLSPEKAAILGVFNHGLAGDKAIDDSKNNSIIAGDILNWL